MVSGGLIIVKTEGWTGSAGAVFGSFDGAEAGAALHETGGKTVAQAVDGCVFQDAGFLLVY
jgi:hypothetical protein